MRILIADDHAIFRQGLRAALRSLADTIVIDEAADLSESIQRMVANCPDLVLLDLRMPGMDGFEGIARMRRSSPAVPIVVLSASEDSDDVIRALATGASGYLPKSAPADTILDALRLVLVGGIHVPRELLTRNNTVLDMPVSNSFRLTARQLEVLKEISAGRSNKEIAFRLGTSEGTIKAHVTAIMRQLGVRNRVQMLLAAERAGLKPN